MIIMTEFYDINVQIKNTDDDNASNIIIDNNNEFDEYNHICVYHIFINQYNN